MRKVLTLISAIALTACLEPQPEPDVKEIPISEFTIETLAKGFSAPWSVAETSQGYFVTERGGKLFRIIGNAKTEITGLPDDIYVAGQGGLLEVAPAPDFDQSKELYISYAYGGPKENGTALLRASLKGDTLENASIIFRASPPKAAASHFGGRIVFLPDNTLILTLGDGFAYREEAQNLDSHLGKIVRLNRDGGTPSNNPKLGGKPQIYSYGHRNVQGLAYDRETGNLWEHEHGPRGGDELNLIKPGQNYGWPIATTGLDYNGAKISPFKTYEGMTGPVHDWVPSIAPSGLAIYRGDMFPKWNGDALIGGLVSKDLRRIDLENGASLGETSLLSDLGERVRDVRIDQSGAILVLTDDPENGKLLRVTPK
ncbi:PQQ-dependent sugar dehydrogenase [Hellea balneolensis]|uniref:PQQ-dependent sugar dehydrogenase n=1 Tax=Hellea balneolensis TaxID=287478 RepID=UPI00040A0321|nr:PQQ-dependent sugar dehydrogenase [Hellea balneolensis]